jgi:HK97 family phage prohead protease
MSEQQIIYKLATRKAPTEVAPRTFTFVASTARVDSQNDIISLDAWDLSRYLENPIILALHDQRSFPVASVSDIGVSQGALRGTMVFPPEGTGPESDQAYRLVQSGTLRALSVGFLIHDFEMMSNGVRRITKAELLEISLVAAGANADAMVKSTGSDATLKALQAENASLKAKLAVATKAPEKAPVKAKPPTSEELELVNKATLVAEVQRGIYKLTGRLVIRDNYFCLVATITFAGFGRPDGM